jgi:hypothetical protein
VCVCVCVKTGVTDDLNTCKVATCVCCAGPHVGL